MKQLFHIASGERRGEGGEALLLQAGERHCALAITDPGGKKVHQLLYCSLDPLQAETLETFLAAYPETTKDFVTVAVSYDLPAALLAPGLPGTEINTWTDLFYETAGTDLKLAEPVPGKTLQLLYTVPAKTGLLAGQKFNGGKYWHQYSVAVQAISNTGNEDRLLVDFKPDEFTVTAASGNRLLLVQSFPYAAPEDVIYYLLKICRHHHLSQQQVRIQLSGLIDKESTLYKELYQYFLWVDFRDATWDMPGEDYPAHYFTSLNDLARCAL